MKKSSLYLTLLLLLSSTVLYGQTGKPATDTVRCYGLTELRYIASTVVAGRTCDTLLQSANAKIANRESLIKEKGIEIIHLNTQLSLKDQIILKKEDDVKAITLNLNKEKRNHKFTKLGWVTTSVLLGSLIIFVAVR